MIKPLYVTDTNALFWYLTEDKKLTQKALAIFEAAERAETQIVVSAIVLAELYYLDKKWNVFEDFTKVYHQLEGRPEFLFIPFEAHDVLDLITDTTIPEMHDRIITGLARRLGIPLITSDSKIIAAGLVEIVW